MTPAENVAELQTAVGALREIQGFFDVYQRGAFPERPPEFFALELAGEAGEVANLEKKIWRGKGFGIDGLEDEAADVLIAVMNYANSREIDLAGAVIRKLGVIEERRAKGLM